MTHWNDMKSVIAERDRYCGQLEKLVHYFASLVPDWRDDSTDMADAITNYSQALKAERDHLVTDNNEVRLDACILRQDLAKLQAAHDEAVRKIRDALSRIPKDHLDPFECGLRQAYSFSISVWENALGVQAEEWLKQRDAVRKIQKELAGNLWSGYQYDETARYRDGLRFALSALGASEPAKEDGDGNETEG
jgi:hypothetical protein